MLCRAIRRLVNQLTLVQQVVQAKPAPKARYSTVLARCLRTFSIHVKATVLSHQLPSDRPRLTTWPQCRLENLVYPSNKVDCQWSWGDKGGTSCLLLYRTNRSSRARKQPFKLLDRLPLRAHASHMPSALIITVTVGCVGS